MSAHVDAVWAQLNETARKLKAIHDQKQLNGTLPTNEKAGQQKKPKAQYQQMGTPKRHGPVFKREAYQDDRRGHPFEPLILDAESDPEAGPETVFLSSGFVPAACVQQQSVIKREKSSEDTEDRHRKTPVKSSVSAMDAVTTGHLVALFDHLRDGAADEIINTAEALTWGITPVLVQKMKMLTDRLPDAGAAPADDSSGTLAAHCRNVIRAFIKIRTSLMEHRDDRSIREDELLASMLDFNLDPAKSIHVLEQHIPGPPSQKKPRQDRPSTPTQHHRGSAVTLPRPNSTQRPTADDALAPIMAPTAAAAAPAPAKLQTSPPEFADVRNVLPRNKYIEIAKLPQRPPARCLLGSHDVYYGYVADLIAQWDFIPDNASVIAFFDASSAEGKFTSSSSPLNSPKREFALSVVYCDTVDEDNAAIDRTTRIGVIKDMCNRCLYPPHVYLGVVTGNAPDAWVIFDMAYEDGPAIERQGDPVESTLDSFADDIARVKGNAEAGSTTTTTNAPPK